MRKPLVVIDLSQVDSIDKLHKQLSDGLDFPG